MVDKVDPRTGELVTTNYGWTKPTVGSSTDAWGGYLNTDLDGIDSTVFTVSGVANAAQTTANAALPKAGGTLTGALTPSQPAGIVGTTTNNNAAAGSVGEFINSAVPNNTVTLTSGTPTNVTSISLTPGDWDVWGEVWFLIGTGAATAIQTGISMTSATVPTQPTPNGSRTAFYGTMAASSIQDVAGLKCRISIAATTTVYLIAYAAFPSGTTTCGGSISARRRR